MPSNIEQFIEEIVEASKLSLVKKNQLRKELYSDFFDKQRDLHLQGFDEQKSLAMIKQSFGNTQIITKELHMIHTQLTTRDWIWRAVLLWCLSVMVITFLQQFIRCGDGDGEKCIVGLTVVSILAPLLSWLDLLIVPFNNFSLIFLGINIALIFIAHSVLWVFKKYFRTPAQRKRVVGLIFSAALVLNFLSIFLSQQTVRYSSESYAIENNLPQSIAGFPLKVFRYPFPPLGNDQVPLDAWFNFYLNYVIWLGVSMIAYFFIPQKIKDSNYAVITLFIIASTSTIYSLGWILFQFD